MLRKWRIDFNINRSLQPSVMRVLVLGQGGREHALVRALKFSKSVSEVHVVPGSAGMQRDALCHSMELAAEPLIALCRSHAIDLVVIGPETPLVEGLADALRQQGIAVFGPSKEAAQLEGSKVFSKEFMRRHSVQTAGSTVVTSVAQTLHAASTMMPPFVLKADGLAAGKGVFICQSFEELKLSAIELFESQTLGVAGHQALLEEFLKGFEVSFLVLTNGQGDFEPLVLAQDHKRLQNGDQGPNTGGMGAIAPLHLDESTYQQILAEAVVPSIQGLVRDGLDFRGVLYIGVMVTPHGPRVLEYNVRFGDPEAQVILPLLEGDWGLVLKQVAEGQVPRLAWRPTYAATVVMAAPGYPGKLDLDGAKTQISGDVFYESPMSYFIHCATSVSADNVWRIKGGRVLNAVGLGTTLNEALKNAYNQASHVNWRGLQKRTDIGATNSFAK